MAKVIVHISGGCLIDYTTDTDNIDLMIVDYDNEKEEGETSREYRPVAKNERVVALTEQGEE